MIEPVASAPVEMWYPISSSLTYLSISNVSFSAGELLTPMVVLQIAFGSPVAVLAVAATKSVDVVPYLMELALPVIDVTTSGMIRILRRPSWRNGMRYLYFSI